MGMKLYEQCDKDKYFSISTIDKERMKAAGLNMTVTKLRELAKKSLPVTQLPTGSVSCDKKVRLTKIYRYSDFLEESG